MAVPVTYIYAAPLGQAVVAGRSSAAAPDLTGGTVTTLLKDWSGTGFQLLSTAPPVDYSPQTAIYTASGHMGAAWDAPRGILWMYGCESHGQNQMINTPYRWDSSDGKFKRQYQPDVCVGQHHITAAGIHFADAANTRPWGSHTFDALWYDPSTKELAFAYDSEDHAFWMGALTTAQQNALSDTGTYSAASRSCPFWYYNTATGTWRYQASPAITAFVKASTGTPVVRDPGNGWWRVDGANVAHLSEDGATVTNGSIYGMASYAYTQAKLHNFTNHIVIIGGYYASPGTWLGAIHPKANLAGSKIMMLADFPALSGWDATNTWSCPLPDGRIVFGAQDVSGGASGGQLGAFILDWNKATPTVVDTGYRLGASVRGVVSSYTLKCVWSAAHNCVILITDRLGDGNDRVYGLRV